VFIDETWVKTNMAPLRGWGTRGRRLKAYAPHGHWKTLTFIAALRHDRIDAPWVIDGPINGEIFLLYIEKILAPTLSPGDVVVLDNLGSHKGNAARAIVRAKRAHLIFLPPYSPDLNPIEQCSPSSNISSERPSPVTSKPPGERSASSPSSSLQPRAPTTSLTPDTVPSKRVAL
jgi:transposase